MRYPIGIQDFEKIRRDGFIYVDKTDLIYKLSHGSASYCFLSRPRRFGKSLLVSTMEAYFSCRKDLFDGLGIYGLEKEWIQYPVLRFDLTGKFYTSEESLFQQLDQQLSVLESRYGIQKPYGSADVRFQSLIEAAYEKTGRQVVILIDEYDKPIVDNLGEERLLDIYRKQLQGFYSVMKAKDKYIRFGFLTGVTKIGELSIFSGLNNLTDISMEKEYADICGLTEKELRGNFQEGIMDMAEANALSLEECFGKLEKTYDGYHFHPSSAGVYNPFSLLSALRSKEFRFFWFETGTPSFLVEVMKQTDYDVTRLAEEEADSTLLTGIDRVFYNPLPLLYQSGYLTIRDYDKSTGIYTLGFPNQEVKHGFLSFLLDYYTTSRGSGSLLIRQMNKDLLTGAPRDFMKRMEAFFARQNYQIQGNAEKDFQYAMSIILQLLADSVTVRTEDATSEGRMDILLETPRFVYIIEIKINDTAQAALQQIEDKGYARKYADDPRQLFRMGVRFSTATRSIDSWELAQ